MSLCKKIFCAVSTASIALNFLLLTVVIADKGSKIDTSFYQDSAYEEQNPTPSQSGSSQISEYSGSATSVSQIEKNGYDKNVYLTEIAQYSDIVLPYRADKDSSYIDDTLFIGDSNTAGLASFGYMPLQNVLGKKSMGIQGVISSNFVWFKGYSKAVNTVKAVKLLKPRRIIINFGTNNTIGTTATEFKSMYKKALYAIEKAYPYCDVIIGAVLPVGYYRENYNIKQQTIDSFNLVLAQLCQENGYYFLDYSEAFKNPDTGYMQKSCVAQDGIHLNNKGYHLLLEYINDHQLLTKDRRPDTDNIPVRMAEPQTSPELPQTVTAEAENIPTDGETDFASETENIDNEENSLDNKSDDNSLYDISDSPAESSDGINSEIISDSSSDLGNINNEKIIYDPF